MQLQKTKQSDKLSTSNLSINADGEMYQDFSRVSGGVHMNQILSFILMIIAIAAISQVLKAHNMTISKIFILLNVNMYSSVIAIMLQSKSFEDRGYKIILVLSAINAVVIGLAITKVI